MTLVRAMTRLLAARTTEEQAQAAHTLQGAIDGFVASPLTVFQPQTPMPSPSDLQVLAASGERLTEFSDLDLARFNELLPWAAMTAAPGARIVGRSWSGEKRFRLSELVDPRIAQFNDKLPLEGLHVLEAGCFEGIHTIGLSTLGARVTAFDGRIENLVKTMARAWAYKLSCDVLLWNAEKTPPHDLPASWDVLHHVGVLYHLSNPVQHLDLLLPRTRRGVLLDTHVAGDDADAMEPLEVGGRTYRYRRYGEEHRDASPFAGLEDHAKWLRIDDVVGLLQRHGFAQTQVISDRVERNGRRTTIFAFRDMG